METEFDVVEVKAQQPPRIWLRYQDGVEGEVNLSDLVGRGVFEALQDRQTFEKVTIGEFGQISWGGEMELDPYALYMRLTGKSPHEMFPNLKDIKSGA